MKNSNPRHPREGIVERSASHTDLIFSPALDQMKRRDLGIWVWGRK